MKLRLALAAATCLALPVMAHAQPVTGPYVSLEGGTSIANPTGFENRTVGTSGKAYFRNSYAFASSVGYGFGDGFRVELAGNFYRNTVHKFSYNSGLGQTLANGGMNTYGPMVNALYDIDIGLPIFPYVGAGAGYQWQKMNTDLTSEFDGIGGTKGSFAYNIIAGIAYPLPWVPGLSATAEYKFMQLVESRNYDNPVSGPGVWSHFGQSSSSTFLLGLRYQIFNPPPAPPPAPEIISEAAADSKTASVTTLQVSGFTDTSGTPEYNLGLSERRAKAVAAQLETDGVPASEIEIHAFGDTHLLVATGPGVREPQNRRVEIVLQ
jgi:OmpA-OmpF porin, OOP family